MFETKSKKTKAINKVNIAISGLSDAITNLEKSKTEIDSLVTANKTTIDTLTAENNDLESASTRAQKIAKNISKLLEI